MYFRLVITYKKVQETIIPNVQTKTVIKIRNLAMIFFSLLFTTFVKTTLVEFESHFLAQLLDSEAGYSEKL